MIVTFSGHAWVSLKSTLAISQAALKNKMLDEAQIIIDSIDWLQKEIEKKLSEFESAELIGDETQIRILKSQIFDLLSKINRENANMDDYMDRYTRLIKNEKEELLSTVNERQALSLRGFSKNQRGTLVCQKVSGEA